MNQNGHKVPPDANLKDFINIERYFDRKPAIFNKYYETNLLDIVDRLPPLNQEERNKFKPQNNKKPAQDTLNKKTDEDQKVSQKLLLQNVTLAQFHESDRLNQDTRINQYTFTGLLGRGAHSVVRLCKSSSQTQQNVQQYVRIFSLIKACKILCFQKIRKKYFIKPKQLNQMITNEIILMKELKNQNIIAFKQAIYLKEKQKVFLVMEHCSKGTINKIGNDNLTLDDDEWWGVVKGYFRQFVNGVKFMHDRNYVHRDIKPENLLINDKNQLKIIDFNVSIQLPQHGKIKISSKFIGTKGYAAPQIILDIDKQKQCDGKRIDIWAMGVTLLELLERRHPYPAKTLPQLIRILENYGKQKSKQIAEISKMKDKNTYLQHRLQINTNYPSELKDLLQKMLKFKNPDRITIGQISKHKWLIQK